jgi:hypothetical protein
MNIERGELDVVSVQLLQEHHCHGKHRAVGNVGEAKPPFTLYE